MNSLDIAIKAGIDVSLIEENLRLTLEQRVEQHQRALDMLEQLESAFTDAQKKPLDDNPQQPPSETL